VPRWRKGLNGGDEHGLKRRRKNTPEANSARLQAIAGALHQLPPTACN
jgi:hypothetical protein